MDNNPYQSGKSFNTSSNSSKKKLWKVLKNYRRLIGVLIVLAAIGAFMFGSSFQVASIGSNENNLTVFYEMVSYSCFIAGAIFGILGVYLGFGN